MEVLWKMARSQSELSHSPGMILGKNMKISGERIHMEKANLYCIVISQRQNVLGDKNENSEKKVKKTSSESLGFIKNDQHSNDFALKSLLGSSWDANGR